MDSKSNPHWSERYRMSNHVVLRIGAFWMFCALGLMVFFPEFVDIVDAKVTAPVQFHLREFIGKSPQQHPKLKIFTYDDQAYAEFGTGVPTVAHWGRFLDVVVSRRPRAIVIDGMFSAPPTETAAEIDAALGRVRESGIPVYIGTFASTTMNDLQGRSRLDLDRPQYRPERYLKPSVGPLGESMSAVDQLNRIKTRKSPIAFGPTPKLAPYFSGVGHFQLIFENKAEPFIRIKDSSRNGSDTGSQTSDHLIPYIGMFLANDVHYDDGILLIDGEPVGLDRHGAIDINFLPARNWDKNSFLRLVKSYPRAINKPDGTKEEIMSVPGDDIEEGDVVLMLPLYFTGNTDFRSSPYGMMSGGLFIASMMNSVLTGRWLQPILATEALTFLGIAVVVLGGMFATSRIFWFATSAFAMGLFCTSQFLFSWYGQELPWVLPSVFTLVAGTHLFAVKAIRSELKAVALRSALDGAVASDQLKTMLRNPDSISFEPRERVVTLMFVDVVGFSIAAENMLPRLAFDNLKAILSEISDVVHAFGGVVDKTLGDGLLCYFGYRFDADSSSADHAEKALACGIRIQELNVERNLAAARTGDPLYPLRIGINTASCYLGNLGSGQRIEFTVVGNGVNFAKRLEGACETFSVMMGPTTWELVQGVIGRPEAVTRKMIHIKHHEELVDAYEYDPFIDHQKRRDDVMELFRKAANLQRLNERIPVNDVGALVVATDLGNGFVLNFNGSGLSIQLSSAVPRSTVIKVQLSNRQGRLHEALREIDLSDLLCEVRWCYQAPGGYVHGLHIQNIPDDRRKLFLSIVSKHVFGGDSIELGELKKLDAS